jgi:uncharacterized protein
MPTHLLNPPYLLVRDSPIAGRGIFTTRAFRTGETICIVTGEVVDEPEALRREREEQNWYIYWNHAEHYIDVADSGLGRYVNHCCTPNAVTAPRDNASVTLVALRDIAAGDELTIDYDYPEIYALCQRVNAHCLQSACPRIGEYI